MCLKAPGATLALNREKTKQILASAFSGMVRSYWTAMQCTKRTDQAALLVQRLLKYDHELHYSGTN